MANRDMFFMKEQVSTDKQIDIIFISEIFLGNYVINQKLLFHKFYLFFHVELFRC